MTRIPTPALRQFRAAQRELLKAAICPSCGKPTVRLALAVFGGRGFEQLDPEKHCTCPAAEPPAPRQVVYEPDPRD